MSKIIVQNTPITVLSVEEQDYISFTDMATAKEGDNRLVKLNQIAIHQMSVLESGDNDRKLLK